VKFGTCLPETEVICGRGSTCDAAESDSRNSMRMPFGADLTGGNSTVISFQDHNKIAIGRTVDCHYSTHPTSVFAHFHEVKNRRKQSWIRKQKQKKPPIAGWLLTSLSAIASNAGHKRALTWVK
jgi:hypothetical protein